MRYGERVRATTTTVPRTMRWRVLRPLLHFLLSQPRRPVHISFYTDRIKESSGVPRDRAPLDCEHASAATIGGIVCNGWDFGPSFVPGRHWGDQWGSVGFGVAVDKVRAVAEFVGCSWSG